MQDRIDGRIALRTSWTDRHSAIDVLEDLAYVRKIDLDITEKSGRWSNEYRIAVMAKDPVDLALFMQDIDHHVIPCKSMLKF